MHLFTTLRWRTHLGSLPPVIRPSPRGPPQHPATGSSCSVPRHSRFQLTMTSSAMFRRRALFLRKRLSRRKSERGSAVTEEPSHHFSRMDVRSLLPKACIVATTWFAATSSPI
eukprot:Rmarinus@m.12512